MNKQYKKISWIVVAFGTLFAYFYFSALHERYLSINSFDDCVKAHFTVLATYPEVCVLPGKKFVNQKQVTQDQSVPTDTKIENRLSFPYESLTYTVNGQPLTFKDGIGVVNNDSTTGEATTTFTLYSKPFIFNSNASTSDSYAIVTEARVKGSVVGYYVFLALALQTTYSGTNGAFLGKELVDASFNATGTNIYITVKDVHQKQKKVILTITDTNTITVK